MPTFLFTAVEDATRLWQRWGDAMARALADHDALVAGAISATGGRLLKNTGDGVFAVFDEPTAAAAAAIELQERVASHDWGEAGIRVGAGLHAGDSEERDGDFFGPAVNRAARLCRAAWGGQILLSDGTARRCSLPPGCTVLDLGLHLLKDLGEPERIFQIVSPDLAGREFPPLRTASASSYSLPPQPTPFVGRESELAEACALIVDPAVRLLTILGPGGVGKTRLGIEAAGRMANRFSLGVRYVPLALAASAADVLTAVADAFHFTFAARSDPRVQILEYLGGKNVLLLIDNFEHVMGATPLILDILEAAPNVKIVITSREKLHVRAERPFELSGMAYPSSPSAVWEKYGAARLLVETMRRGDPAFNPEVADLPHIIKVCELVGGLPLAIELAASWTRILTLPEIAAELERGLDILTTEGADVPHRHRSLAAVFDYSYDLLTNGEQRATAALSVFRGGFDRAAAREVAAATLPLLASLADKSLLRRFETGRYELHELIRQYAKVKLDQDAGAAAETVRRHATHFLNLLNDHHPNLKGARQTEAQTEIAAEIDNVRAAWAFAVENRDRRLILLGAEPLFTYYRLRSQFDEGRRVFAHAAEALSDSPDADVTATLLAAYGTFLTQLARYDDATPVLRRAVAVGRRAGLWRAVVIALNAIAAGAFYRGQHDRCVRISDAALAISARVGDDDELIPAYLNKAFCAKAQDDLAAAKDLYLKALEIAREAGDQNRAGIILNNLGNVERGLGNAGEARELLELSLEVGREVGNRRLVSFSLNNLGIVAQEAGDNAAAVGYFEESARIKNELNDLRQLPETLTNLANSLSDLGRHVEAKTASAEGLRVAKVLRLPGKIALALERSAYVLAAAGETSRSAPLLNEGFSCAANAGDEPAAAAILLTAARVLIGMGKEHLAAEILGALLARPPVRFRADHAGELLAGLLQANGDAETAFRRGRGEDWLALGVRIFDRDFV